MEYCLNETNESNTAVCPGLVSLSEEEIDPGMDVSQKRVSMIRSIPAITMFMFAALFSFAGEYSWQKQQAKVLPNGDLEWSPMPFEFVKGEVVRYIDFENGDDNNDGKTKATAWQHHPWDVHASGKAKGEKGIVTYVFKRGVAYRGVITNEAKTGKSGKKGILVGESGEPGNPIRLTSDPSWGEGQAMILGSIKLPGEWKPAKTVSYPKRIPEIDKVWALDLNALGVLDKEKNVEIITQNSYWGKSNLRMPFLGLFRVDSNGASHMQHLARTPDWQQGDENFVLDYWHKMDGSKMLKDGEGKKAKLIAKGIWDEDVLKGHPQDWFTGGYIWPQYGHFMGGPMPREIKDEVKNKRGKVIKHYNPKDGVIYEGCYGNWHARLRYMIDNLPQYLDHDEEFYYDPESAHLFYRPPAGQDPNKMHLEWTRFGEGVYIDSQKHIEISGLHFKYQNTVGVGMYNDVENVTVRNCSFEDMLEYGVSQGMKNYRSDKDKATGKPRPHYATNIRIHDCDFRDIWTTAVHLSADQDHGRVLGHIELLRSNFLNTGIRHKDNVQTPLPCVEILYPQTGEIAGNIVEDSWGSGLMIFAGITSGGTVDWPLSRVLVHHNKTIDTALAVNDYGGMSLWQGGPIYCYNNNIGNSPGYMPAGITMFGGSNKGFSLSYPLYLDGAYKIYSFNNIVWARTNDKSQTPFATNTPGYFMVFGFLNQLTNNTFYRTGKGVGGSGGHRNDVVSNLFCEVGSKGDKRAVGGAKFIAHDRQGDPSLVGGGDDGSSGRRGVPTLAYANNVFHGSAKAGQLLRQRPEAGITKGIEGDTIEKLAQAMTEFPIRYGQLGWRAEEKPIKGKGSTDPIQKLSEVDFRPVDGSTAIDRGATYFIPWSLHGCVGEWHFTENHADPARSVDYAWYQSQAHYYRMMYEYVPPLDLQFNHGELTDYVPSPSEDWCKGALVFNGSRIGTVKDSDMRADIVLPTFKKNKKGELVQHDRYPSEPWIVPKPIEVKKDAKGRDKPVFAKDSVYRYPGKLRNTLISRNRNLLVEVNLKAESPGGILGKHDNRAGYELRIDAAGKPQFCVTAKGQNGCVTATQSITDGRWHHVLAEIDRETGRMTIYIDGKKSAESKCPFPQKESLDSKADFIVGKTHDGKFLKGTIDFMRVCHGTLADAQTDIAELHEWQTNGPFKYDMAGKAPIGRRDAGALERGTK